jgi:hypothetical protein
MNKGLPRGTFGRLGLRAQAPGGEYAHTVTNLGGYAVLADDGCLVSKPAGLPLNDEIPKRITCGLEQLGPGVFAWSLEGVLRNRCGLIVRRQTGQSRFQGAAEAAERGGLFLGDFIFKNVSRILPVRFWGDRSAIPEK